MAPEADIIVGNVFNTAGSALESDFVKKLDVALQYGVDIFHLSVTTPTRNNTRWCPWRPGWTDSGSTRVSSVLPRRETRHPAAVLAGRLSGWSRSGRWTDWRSRADFSNYGGWVDVYAPGSNLVNAYATGIYTCHADPFKGKRKFYGMAKWSGTSFSTPVVTGLIAARMSRTGENARLAAAALLAEARAKAIPGVGPVLLPCWDGQDNCCGHCDCGHCGGGDRGRCGGGCDCRCGDDCGCGRDCRGVAATARRRRWRPRRRA